MEIIITAVHLIRGIKNCVIWYILVYVLLRFCLKYI